MASDIPKPDDGGGRLDAAADAIDLELDLELAPGATDAAGELLVTSSHEDWNALCADLERWLLTLPRL